MPKIDAGVFQLAYELCETGKTKGEEYIFLDGQWSTKQLMKRLCLWLARLNQAPVLQVRPNTHCTKFYTLVCLLTFDPYNYLSWSNTPTELDKFDHGGLFKWVWQKRLQAQEVLADYAFTFTGGCETHYNAYRAAYRKKSKLLYKQAPSSGRLTLAEELAELDVEMGKNIDLITSDCRTIIMNNFEKHSGKADLLTHQMRNRIEPAVSTLVTLDPFDTADLLKSAPCSDVFVRQEAEAWQKLCSELDCFLAWCFVMQSDKNVEEREDAATVQKIASSSGGAMNDNAIYNLTASRLSKEEEQDREGQVGAIALFHEKLKESPQGDPKVIEDEDKVVQRLKAFFQAIKQVSLSEERVKKSKGLAPKEDSLTMSELLSSQKIFLSDLI